jgi:hypothetical protein
MSSLQSTPMVRTLWSMVSLEKLPVPRLLKKFLAQAYYEARSFMRVHGLELSGPGYGACSGLLGAR